MTPLLLWPSVARAPRHEKFIDPHMVADADRSATSEQRSVAVQREFVRLTLQEREVNNTFQRLLLLCKLNN